MQRWIIAIGILGTLPGPALAVAQVSTPQDSLKNLEALRVLPDVGWMPTTSGTPSSKGSTSWISNCCKARTPMPAPICRSP